MPLIDPGKRAPAFSLKDQHRHTHTLSDCAGRPVVLFFHKFTLTFPLLADTDHAVAEKYGVWQKKSLYGRSFMGIARTTYLIGGDGKVAKRWDRVKVDGHAEDVLAAVRALVS